MKHTKIWKGVDFISVIGIVFYIQKKEASSIAKKVIEHLQKRNIIYYIEENSAEILNIKEKTADYKKLRTEADYIVIIGGDGTFLHTAHYFIGTKIPLLGINIGQLGFLTEIETNELEEALDNVIKGNYELEKRLIIKAEINSKGEIVYQNYALNDFVIHRGAHARLVAIELYINEEIVHSYRADGIIVSTPTGSTAYSLSAGGPIVNPQIRAIIVTPICPHSLFITPLIISDKEKVKIKISGNNNLSFTADGRAEYTVGSEDEILIEAAEKELFFIKLPNRTFYSILHKKMNIGLM
ncbi:MAG: NAD(+) kinase [Halanaerobiaceae bacterium]|nr:NAD(+) kinase [Halanaerobiaceae bacterium]